MKPTPIKAIFAGCCLATSLPMSHAVHAEGYNKLDKINISAEKEIETETIDSEEIEKSQPRDLRDVFKNQTSVNVGGSVSNAQKIYLRGVEDANINITVDGARQNVNLFHHQGRMNVDPDLLKQVEVEAGPAAADQGYAALGGSVAFTTKDADDFLRPGETFGAKVQSSFSSADDGIGGSITTYGKLSDNVGLMAYVKRRSNKDVQAGEDETIPDSAGDQTSYLLKGTLKQEKGHNLSVSLESHTDEGEYNNRANFPWQSNVSALSAAMDQRHNRKSYVANHQYLGDNPQLNIKTNLYFNETSIDYLDDISNWVDQFSSESVGGDVSNTFTFKTADFGHKLTLGVDYIQDKTLAEVDGISDSKEKASNVGLFLQDRIQFENMRLSVGARFDNYETEYANNEKVSGDGFSPNATFEVDATDNLTLSLGYGESIRGANLNHNLWAIPAGTLPGFGLSPTFSADGLKPERSKKWEMGASYKAKSFFKNQDQLMLNAKIYRNDIENFAKYNMSAGQIHSLYNADDDVTSKGYEAQAQWTSGHYRTSLSYNHTTMRDEFGEPFGDSGAQTMRKAAAFGDKLIFDNSYRFADLDLEIGYTLTHVAKLTDVADGSTEKPGYTLHDVSLLWYPLPKEDLTVQLAVKNLTDKSYSDHTTLFVNGEGTKEPGRDVRLNLSYQF